MKRLLSCVIGIAMGMFLMSGSGLAWDELEHVTVAPNGKGDAGVFPLYVAYEGGWETKIEIINTHPSLSTVAKVAVRSAKYSQEILDFMIYLSPTDVWTGYLNYGPAGARLVSTDGSCLAGTRATGPKPGQWASALDPMDVELVDYACDVNEMGYVEVIEAWHGFLGMPPVDKDDIFDAYENAIITSESGTLNSLAMHYEINYAPLFNAAERAVVYRDYDVTDKLTTGAKTYIGSAPSSSSRNSFCEVEAALSKDFIAMPYYANDSPFSTLHFLTFHTKNTIITPACMIVDVLSPFFQQNSDEDWCINYGVYFWDLEENSPSAPGHYSPFPEEQRYRFCDEVNFITPGPTDIKGLGFDEGWILYAFDTVTSCTPQSGKDSIQYSGAPVIPVILLIEGSGMSLMSAAWDDGFVFYNGWPAYFYHYGPFPGIF